MRISVIPEDPGYRADAHSWRVLVNGQVIHDCLTADAEEGFALAYAPAPGDVMPDLPACPKRTRIERIEGRVSIVRLRGTVTIERMGLGYR